LEARWRNREIPRLTKRPAVLDIDTKQTVCMAHVAFGGDKD
jgi:hypothetical protein